MPKPRNGLPVHQLAERPSRLSTNLPGRIAESLRQIQEGKGRTSLAEGGSSSRPHLLVFIAKQTTEHRLCVRNTDQTKRTYDQRPVATRTLQVLHHCLHGP